MLLFIMMRGEWANVSIRIFLGNITVIILLIDPQWEPTHEHQFSSVSFSHTHTHKHTQTPFFLIKITQLNGLIKCLMPT